MRVGVDVGGTNTDAVLMNGTEVVAWAKQPTTADVSGGVASAVEQVTKTAGLRSDEVSAVMIGTTHFTNALVERKNLDEVGILRLASPSGEALPPLTAWPTELVSTVGRNIFLLPGGYEVDGREIAPFDEARVRDAARSLRRTGVTAVAINSAFAPIDSSMEDLAATIVREEHPEASITLSNTIARIGLIERENAAVLNAALSTLARRIMASFESALRSLGIEAPLFISQNDGTLISAAQAAAYPVMTIGSGPTNSMRGAAFLTGYSDAIVMDVGGTTTDIGVLTNRFPRESSVAANIGGVRTNFRMPDILAIGLGGGTRIHLDPALFTSAELSGDVAIGPDSLGYRISEDAFLFGGETLTASDVAAAAGTADFGNPALLPALSDGVVTGLLGRIRAMFEDSVDRMKTSRADMPIIAVGGGSFLVPDQLNGAASVVRPNHAGVANAVGAAIAQVGGQIEQVVDYDKEPRERVLDNMRAHVRERCVQAGGEAATVEVVEVDEVFLSYLPGHAAQVRMKAVADLAQSAGRSFTTLGPTKSPVHAH